MADNNKKTITYCPFFETCNTGDKCPNVLPEKYRGDKLTKAILKIDVFANKPLCHTDFFK